MDAEQQQEQRYHECRDAEAALNEVPGDIGPEATTGVAEFMLLVHDLPVTRILYQALVGCTSSEI